MTLLIVDDQKSVIDGMLKGIKWDRVPVDNVLTAFNSMDAKTILEEQEVEIILCDIEMPVESGLDLFRWIRDKKMAPYFIFLTSHAEFSYAQEAIRLGAADYVIQPAPYGEIERAITKAMEAVGREQRQELMRNRGKVFEEQKQLIAGDALRNLIENRLNRKVWQPLADMQLLPKLDQKAYLVLIQIVKWHTASEKWEPNLLEFSLANVVKEIFHTQNQICQTVSIEDNLFAVALQGRDREEMTRGNMIQQLQFFCSVCSRFFKCDAACYFHEPELLETAAAQWQELMEICEANVLLKSGIFPQGKAGHATEHTYRIRQVRHWQTLLKEGYPQTVEKEAAELLGQMSEQGKMDQNVLRSFYQDFIQMLYSALEAEGRNLRDFFSTAEEMEYYRNGMKSVQKMQELIRFVAVNYTTRTAQIDSEAVISQVLDYIAGHLEDEIRRDEIAEHVHLNRDYLSRMFRKEMGISLKEYITEQKMKAAQSLLRTTSLPVSYVAAKMGYCNSSHFSYTYKKVMGNTPLEERQDHQEAERYKM